MSRATPIIGTLVLLIFVGGLFYFSENELELPRRAPSTLAVIPSFIPFSIPLPSFLWPQAPEAPAAPVAAPIFPAVPTTPTTTSTLPAAPKPSGSTSLQMAAAALRMALVNIVCRATPGTGLKSISGSGVFISAKGIILTNSHVAAYFLLADQGVSCVIRSGTPAQERYKAALIYISSAWLTENSNILTAANPVGTGEHDFALLAVTASATSTPLPTSYPSIPLSATPIKAGTPIVVATYGSQFLAADEKKNSLFPTVVFGTVKDVFTFSEDTVDVIALGGSSAAQQGSSGGGVTTSSGELAGTVTTSTIKGDIGERRLNAITASYIRSEYERETGQSLGLLLARSPLTAAADFAPRMPALESIVTAHLP